MFDSDNGWDHDAYPPSHLSEREGMLWDALESGSVPYTEQAYGAPASLAGSKTTQDLSGTRNRFVSGMKRPSAKEGCVKRAQPTPTYHVGVSVIKRSP